MRASLLILVIAGVAAGAGCAHRAATPPRSDNAPAESSALLAHAARTRMLHIYVDATPASPAAAAVSATDSPHARTVALSLRDLLRERGFDVRGAETALPPSEPGAIPRDLAQAVAAGETLPAVSRAVTYLHPNAPRLVLFVRLSLGDAPASANSNSASTSTSLGAFIADSADGAILWSNRVATKQPLNDARLRQLTNQLLANLPHLPAT